MARQLALSPRLILLAVAGTLLTGLGGLQAASPATTTTNTPPNAKPAPAAVATKPAPPAPPPGTQQPPDPFVRYGNILQPGNEPAHPLRIELPSPEVGEIKVPNDNELTKREKLEQLATLTDDQIREELAKWPPFTKMSLRDEGMMLAMIQNFREYRAKVAMQAAHNIGLLTLTPPQQAKFQEEYWAKRLPMERDLAKQIEPILKQRENQLNEDLYREFSSTKLPLAQNPPKAPPAPAPAPNKPAPAQPQTANKPPATTSSQTMTVGSNGTPPPMH